jgi:hypothetical protein
MTTVMDIFDSSTPNAVPKRPSAAGAVHKADGTDATFGYATALSIATDAIDPLHSTAHSHHRIIVPFPHSTWE